MFHLLVLRGDKGSFAWETRKNKTVRQISQWAQPIFWGPFFILSVDTAPWPSSLEFLTEILKTFSHKHKAPGEVGLWYIQDQDLKALLIELRQYQYRGTNTSDDVPVICWKEEDFLAKMLTPSSVWAQVFSASTGEAGAGWGLRVAWWLRDSIFKQHVCLLPFLISWLKKRLEKQGARYE